MTPLAGQVLEVLLSDEVAAASGLGVAHSAFESALDEIDDLGIELAASSAGQWHLANRPDLIDRARLEEGLLSGTLPRLDALSVVRTTASTNVDALAAPPPSKHGGAVWLTEYQSAGQGRRGKTWVSPFASGLCISVAFRMPLGADLGRLPLALGIGLRGRLIAMGAASCQIKWPNDLLLDGRKLGGLLINARQIPGDDAVVVAGLGLNIYRAPPPDGAAALTPTALVEWLGADMPDRTTLAVELIGAVFAAVHTYSQSGFDAFAAQWSEADYLHDRVIEVLQGQTSSAGVARGIDPAGRLLVETETGLVALNGGEVSVRMAGIQ